MKNVIFLLFITSAAFAIGGNDRTLNIDSIGVQNASQITLEDTVRLNSGTASTVPYLDASKDIVSSSVTPTELGYVSGVTSSIQTQIDSKQATDADLSAIAALTGTGYLARTGAGTYVERTITGDSNEITISNGDGVSGNTTIGISDNPILPGTGSVIVPSGTEAQRPGTPSNGMFRYSTTANTFEGYSNGSWGPIAGAGSSDPVLTNGDFEDATVTTGWTNANGSAAAESSTINSGDGGVQSIAITLSSESLDLSQSVNAGSSNLDESFNNSNPSFSCYVNASSAVELCFTFGTSEVSCKAYDTNKLDTWQRLEAQGYVAAGTNFGVKLKSSSISDVVYADNCEFNPVANYVDTKKQLVFGARIANNGTASITSQGGKNDSGQNAIATVSRTASGDVTLNWTSGFFTVAPSVTVTVDGVSGNAFAMVESISTTSAVIIVDEDAGSPVDRNFNVVITRQGADAEDGSENLITALKSNITEWASYTPTFTGFGTATNVEFYWKRIGSDLHVRGYFTGGTHTATEARISFPSGLTSSANINGSVEVVGMMNSTQTTSTRQFSVLAEQSVTYFTFNRADTSSQTMNKVTGTNLSAGGSNWSFFARVPIAGWDSSAEFLGAVPINQTCYVKDVKSSGTAGGTFTSGAWQTRDLNTTSGDCWFISLTSNQFTVSPGKYEIEALAPAYKVADHKIKLVSDPSGSPTDEIVGLSAISVAADGVSSLSTLSGNLDLSSSETYEIQHRSAATQASNGFGTAASFGVSEVYTQVKITRIKP